MQMATVQVWLHTDSSETRSVTSLAGPAAELIQILEHTPLLVEMDLPYCWFGYRADDEIMKRLIYDADSDGEEPCLVRNLKILIIGDWLFKDPSLIADLIQSRWFPKERKHDAQSDSSRLKPSCLSDVYLQVNQRADENTMKEIVLPRLWRCQRQGLAFRIRLPGEIYDRCMEGA